MAEEISELRASLEELEDKYEQLQQFVTGLYDPVEAFIEVLKDDGRVHDSNVSMWSKCARKFSNSFFLTPTLLNCLGVGTLARDVKLVDIFLLLTTRLLEH